MSLDDTFKCPSCRKGHQIDHARSLPATCSRCDCELEMLIVIRTSAAAILEQAWQALREMDTASASKHAEYAWEFIESKEIAECCLIASVLTQDRPEISKWEKRLMVLSSSQSPLGES